jgi:hypothetical protein
MRMQQLRRMGDSSVVSLEGKPCLLTWSALIPLEKAVLTLSRVMVPTTRLGNTYSILHDKRSLALSPKKRMYDILFNS